MSRVQHCITHVANYHHFINAVYRANLISVITFTFVFIRQE